MEPGVAAMEPMVVSEDPTVVPEAPMRAESLSCPVLKVLAPISVASHFDWVVVRQIGEDPRHKVDLNSLGQLKGMEIGPHPRGLSP